jgi:hypothetical protein
MIKISARKIKLTSIDGIEEASFIKQFGAIPLGEGIFFPLWYGRVTPRTASVPGVIRLGGSRILHISDVHLGADFHFRTPSPAPEGFARWSLRLLEEKVVELHIVERQRQHDRADAKKTFSNRIASNNG